MIITVEGVTLATLNALTRFLGGKRNRIADDSGNSDKIPVARLVSVSEASTRDCYQITVEVRERYDADTDDPEGNTRLVPGEYLIRIINVLGLFTG